MAGASVREFSVSLWEGAVPGADPALDTPNRMTAYLADADAPCPAVVVFPGGGYAGRAPHEGEPIARFYQENGFHAFVVDYRVAPYEAPCPLLDAQRAIALVRQNAAAWGVDAKRVFVCGFSAGAHLAGSTAVMKPLPEIEGDCRPNGAILCYPVISGLPEHGHTDSLCRLLGERYEAEREAYSLQLLVNEQTPPCFIWQTAEDRTVPVCNSLVMADALTKHGVPCELHIFPFGYHGVGLANGRDGTPLMDDTGKWAPLSVDWIRRQA